MRSPSKLFSATVAIAAGMMLALPDGGDAVGSLEATLSGAEEVPGPGDPDAVALPRSR
jgi:hypothetical protein